MSELASTDWMHSPGAWRVAQACEDNMRRFERGMRDLRTAPGVSREEAQEIAMGLVRMAQVEMGVETDGAE